MDCRFPASDVGEGQCASWTNQDAGAASNAAVGSNLEGGAYLLLNASINEADGSNANNFLAGSHAQTAKDAIILLHPKAGLIHTEFTRESLDQRDMLSRGHEQLHGKSSRLQDRFRVGSDHKTVRTGMSTGSYQPPPSGGIHLNNTQTARCKWLQGFMVAQGRDTNAVFSCHLENGSIRFSLNFPAINGYADHVQLLMHHDRVEVTE
jgi:hypothetical protein